MHYFSSPEAFGILPGFGRVDGGNPQCRWDASHVTDIASLRVQSWKSKHTRTPTRKHCGYLAWRFLWGLGSFFRRFDRKPRRLSTTFADFKMLCGALQPEVTVDARAVQRMAACGSLAPTLMTWALGIWTVMTQVDPSWLFAVPRVIETWLLSGKHRWQLCKCPCISKHKAGGV